MNRTELNDDLIIRYLLGDLPKGLAEELDELAVTDEEVFERVEMVENDLIDRYVKGELEKGEAALFEKNYLESPLRREKLEFARSFQEYGGRDLESRENATITQAERHEIEKKGGISSWFSSLGIFGGAQPAFRFAVAACGLLVAVLGGWLIISVLRGGREVAVNSTGNMASPTVRPTAATPENRSGNSVPTPSPAENRAVATPMPTATPAKPTPSPVAEPKAPAQPVIASFLLTPPLRGSAVPAVNVPAAADRAAVRVELESDSFKSYTVELKDSNGRTVWKSGRRSPSGRYINLIIPAKTLRPAVYTLSVSGQSDDGTIEIFGDYPFRVVR